MTRGDVQVDGMLCCESCCACAVLCRAALCCAVLCCAAPCRAVLCCAVLCCAEEHTVVLQGGS